MLKDRIEQEFKEALRQKNEARVSCIRMLKADMQNLAIQKREELKEEQIIQVIQKQIKQHKDSIEQFEKGNRIDLVAKEKGELAVLEAYLPDMLSENELQAIVKDVIRELGVSTKKDMGKVMKEVLARAKGRADGKAVSSIVSNSLT